MTDDERKSAQNRWISPGVQAGAGSGQEPGNILALANREDLDRVEFVEEKASGRIAWRKRRIADVLAELREGDVLVVSELSRLGRSMLECMEILSIAANADIRVYAIKGSWRLDETIQIRIIAMAFSMAAEIEHDLLSARTKEALRARKVAGKPLGRTARRRHVAAESPSFGQTCSDRPERPQSTFCKRQSGRGPASFKLA